MTTTKHREYCVLRKLHEAGAIPIISIFDLATKGQSLATIIELKGYESRIPAFIDGMVGALYVVHSQAIIHRNITLDSFWCDPDGNISLRGFKHAIFNTSNKNFTCQTKGKHRYPSWGPQAPGVRKKYGTEYDIWCLGLCILQILFPDTKFYDDQQISELCALPNTGLEYEYGYRTIMQGCLLTNPDDRFCTYALKNMCDIPIHKLWQPQTIKSFCSSNLPQIYIDWLPLVTTDPVSYAKKIHDEEPAPKVPLTLTPICRLLHVIMMWLDNTYYRWTPSRIYVAALIAENALSERNNLVKFASRIIDHSEDNLGPDYADHVSYMINLIGHSYTTSRHSIEVLHDPLDVFTQVPALIHAPIDDTDKAVKELLPQLPTPVKKE